MGTDLLGQGLQYPFHFHRQFGGASISTATSRDHAHIHESLRQILGTRLGERVMHPDFGSRLHELVFEPHDAILYGLIRHAVREAITRWEPRIVITDIQLVPDVNDAHLVLVSITYQLIQHQVEGNFVYPFWREPALQEAS
ncbi:MAG: GPW/gp25 family protein [Armatimonadota bacterium]